MSQESEREPEPEVTWVGEQRLMEGYCGRAPAASPAPQNDMRPIAVVRRRPGQKEVVRIGPPRAAAA